MDHKEMIRVRSRILKVTTTRRLATTERRLVLFRGKPVGIVRRTPGTLFWVAGRCPVPYASVADAALSVIADVFMAEQTGGIEAVRNLVARAELEAASLDPAWMSTGRKSRGCRVGLSGASSFARS